MKISKQVLEEMEQSPGRRCFRDDGAADGCETLGHLSQCWLQSRQDAVKKSTFSGYRYCVQNHILPALGGFSLAELEGIQILSFIEKMLDQGLAETTVRSVLTALRSVIKYGIRAKLVKEGLLEYCRCSCRRPETRILTIEESDRMKTYLLEKNTVFSVGILLCRSTGMRIGELCGLKWKDIDLGANSICIRRTVSRIPNPADSPDAPRTILYIRPPKSHSSAREIPIPRYLADVLQQMQGKEDDYLLTGCEYCMEPRNVQKRFKTILKRCEMQDVNFHAMRHGFASACLEKGVDCKTVSSILGHSSTNITMDIYVHTSMRQKQRCVDVLD